MKTLNIIIIAALLPLVGFSEDQKTYFPGLFPSDAYINLEKRGFTMKRIFQDDHTVWECKFQKTDWQVTAYVVSDGEALKFHTVELVALDFTRGTRLDAIRKLFGFISTLPYDNAKPDKVRAWLEAGVGTQKKMETTDGVVTFLYWENGNGVYYFTMTTRPEKKADKK